ncbi:uroporphyrinogen-III synthase [Nesterenkonia flava]|uniref:Uroporphyrinogen-III synthase n=1 Tax=Nesterenkonia flava TaxID=469799 RepID=A0ABU1FRI8_9MICC|nr:uroporphyrinogen-III synthase [Nesterenkonia flava]MDR5710857.1 uroporphyrinogen-III synthase [Nesterenkonia flava]
MRIVLTRHPAQAGSLEAELREAGVEVAFLPLTIQRLPRDTASLRRAVAELEAGAFSTLLLTSSNTVRALLAAGWDGSVPEKVRVGVVGPGTARTLQQLTGLTTIWMPQAEHSAAGILAELPAPEPGERLLLPQSAQARPVLSTGLRERGWDVHRVIAYETVTPGNHDDGAPLGPGAGSSTLLGSPLDQLDSPRQDNGPAGEAGERMLEPTDLRSTDWVLVTASSAARELLRQVPETEQPRLIAIGEPTAQTLRAAGRPAEAVLASPTGSALLQALVPGH